MTTGNVTGTFELHVFVAPLDPPPEVVARFQAACQGAAVPTKALHLKLDYVNRGFVSVLQTSRYVQGDLAHAIESIHVDAAMIRAAGLEVIREKVEALGTNAGVPLNDDDARHEPEGRYFEFHILIDGREHALSEEDMLSLRSVSRDFSERLRAPVPLSYNIMKPSQRFLNMRGHGVGLDRASAPVHELERRIAGGGSLKVTKLISEYICFDTNPAVDDGWTEPLAGR
jgi:hypothetical protein